jgi:hypothetical protein
VPQATPITTPLKHVTTTRTSIDKTKVWETWTIQQKLYSLIFEQFLKFWFWVSRAGACERFLIHRKWGGRPRTIFWVLIYTWGGTTHTQTHAHYCNQYGTKNIRALLYGTQGPTFHSTLWPNVLQKSHK